MCECEKENLDKIEVEVEMLYPYITGEERVFCAKCGRYLGKAYQFGYGEPAP